MTGLTGKGVHSGLDCTVTLHRTDGPVRFRRNGRLIEVSAANLAGTERATSLAAAGEQVSMVEHLLAALHVRGWWSGLTIEASRPELPVLDGSAAGWLPLLDELGEPPPPPPAHLPADAITVRDGIGSATVTPGEPGLHVTVDFDHPAIGRQTWSGGPEDYGQLLDARTFGFVNDLDNLRQNGLARGAGLDNCLVYGADAPLNEPRGALEPVRHKALDLLGDLYLLGRPLAGRVTTGCGSHRLHARLVEGIRQQAGWGTGFESH